MNHSPYYSIMVLAAGIYVTTKGWSINYVMNVDTTVIYSGRNIEQA